MISGQRLYFYLYLRPSPEGQVSKAYFIQAKSKLVFDRYCSVSCIWLVSDLSKFPNSFKIYNIEPCSRVMNFHVRSRHMKIHNPTKVS